MNSLKIILFLNILLLLPGGALANDKLASSDDSSDEIIDKVIELNLSDSANVMSQDNTSQSAIAKAEEIDLSKIEEAAAKELAAYDAEIIVLNKITAQSERLVIPVEEARFFGNLSLEVNKCYIKEDQYHPDHLMLLTVFDNKLDDDKLTVFHGWVSAASQCVSSLEHPVYEVIPVKCIKRPEIEQKAE